MDDKVIRDFLNKHYPFGVSTRTSTYFQRKGLRIVEIKDECVKRELLDMADNQGEWIYTINKNGRLFQQIITS